MIIKRHYYIIGPFCETKYIANYKELVQKNLKLANHFASQCAIHFASHLELRNTFANCEHVLIATY